MKICPKCGKKLRDEAVFCSECGNDVKDVATVEVVQNPVIQENQQTADSGAFKMLPVIIAGFSVLVAILSLLINVNPIYHAFYLGQAFNNFFGPALTAFTAIILAYIDISNGKKKTLPMIAIAISGFAFFLELINALVFAFAR